MDAEKLKKILAQHKAWLNGNTTAKCASLARENLRGANLRGVNLRGAYLRGANLRSAYLRVADLCGADLCAADLRGADLRHADLSMVDLHSADLRGANLFAADLCWVDLCGADLRGTNLDCSAWPLWCGSLSTRIDKRIASQLLYHALRAMQSCADDPDVAAVLANGANLRLANQFHRVDEYGEIKRLQGMNLLKKDKEEVPHELDGKDM